MSISTYIYSQYIEKRYDEKTLSDAWPGHADVEIKIVTKKTMFYLSSRSSDTNLRAMTKK